MKLVTFLLPEGLLKDIDILVDTNRYPSRSATIRYAVNDLLRIELLPQEPKTMHERETPRARRPSKSGVRRVKNQMLRGKKIHREKRKKNLKKQELDADTY